MLKIHKALTSRSGGVIDSGSIVLVQIHIPKNGSEIHFDISLFRDELSAASFGTVDPTFAKEISNYGIVFKSNPEAVQNMTYSAMIEILRDLLVAELGKGIKVEIVGQVYRDPVVSRERIVKAPSSRDDNAKKEAEEKAKVIVETPKKSAAKRKK